MARGKRVELATRSFENQKLATAFFKEMLGRYEIGSRVGDVDSLDLASLLERHPEYSQKVGCGVGHFEVMIDKEHGTKCFRIVRTDGTGTDFSYIWSIKQAAPSRKLQVSQAFRRLVRIDLYRRRDQFFFEHKGADGRVTCAVTKERITVDEGHMDHRAPMTFEVIVTTFLEGRGLSLDEVPITSGQDEQVSAEITDKVLADAFANYHAKIARLDFVKQKINLAASAPNRLKSTRIMPID
jgi:Protein of unknown function (DUF3223)